MPAIVTSTGSDVITRPTITVSYRSIWSAGWTVLPDVYCEEFVFATNPELGSATLSYRYGVRRTTSGAALATVGPLNAIIGNYVKIEMAPPGGGQSTFWHGIALTEERHQDGAVATGTRIPAGRQVFHCVSMDYLLDRKPIDTSYIQPQGGANEQQVKRGIGFNIGSGHPDQHEIQHWENRSEGTFGSKGVSIFSDVGHTPWSVQDIIQYLIAYYSPADQAGNPILPFKLDPAGQVDRLKVLQPRLHYHGLTFKQILDQLIVRHRLFGYRTWVDESQTPNAVMITVFTFNDQDIALPDSSTLAANPNTVSLDFDASFDIRESTSAISDSQVFDQVTVRGARVGSCFTLIGRGSDGKFIADWAPSDQTKYNNGSPTAAAQSNINEKQALHLEWRKQKPLKRVYAYFRLDTNWKGVDSSGDPVFPQLDQFPASAPAPQGTPKENFWYPGLRFQHRLPLLTDHDYSGGAVKTNGGLVTDTTPSGGHAEYLRPMLFTYDSKADRYEHIESLSAKQDIELYGQTNGNGRGWGASLRMQDSAPGFVVDVDGMPQHAIAKTEFTPADASDQENAGMLAPEFSWQDFYGTFYMYGDHWAEATYPASNQLASQPYKIMLIDIGERARVDYICPGTVVAIKDGQLVTSTGGFLRDDRNYLKNLARIAFEWYGQPRRAFSLTYHQLTNLMTVGQLVTQIGSGATLETVRSAITKIAYNVRAGTTRIHTQFAELDVRAL